MPDLLSYGSHLVRLARFGLKTFLFTLLYVALGGILLAFVSAFFLRHYPGYYRFLAITLVMIETGVIAFYLAGKRTVSLTMAEGFSSMKLGSSLVGVVFARMPSNRPEGAELSPGLQRLEPGQAERLLTDATDDVERQTTQQSGIRQKFQARLLELVRKHSLARVQSTGNDRVDLQNVKEELEQTIDERLADNMRGTARFYTLLVVVGFPLLVALQTYLIMTMAQNAAN